MDVHNLALQVSHMSLDRIQKKFGPWSSEEVSRVTRRRQVLNMEGMWEEWVASRRYIRKCRQMEFARKDKMACELTTWNEIAVLRARVAKIPKGQPARSGWITEVEDIRDMLEKAGVGEAWNRCYHIEYSVALAADSDSTLDDVQARVTEYVRKVTDYPWPK